MIPQTDSLSFLSTTVLIYIISLPSLKEPKFFIYFPLEDVELSKKNPPYPASMFPER